MLRWSVLASAVLLVASCSSSSTSLLNPESTRCAATLAADLLTPEASGGTGRLSIGVTRECQWTAKADVDWISVSQTTGQGEASVNYTVAANPAGVQRQGGLLVNDKRLEIAQRAASCTFSLSRTSDSFDAAGGTRTVSVAAPAACAWDAQSAVPWIIVAAGAAGSGGGSLEFRVEPNTTPSVRTGTLTVAGQTFTVTQSATASLCTMALSPTSRTIESAAATGTVNVTIPAGCAWTAGSDAGWLTITAGLSGTGSGSVSYAALANTGPLSRTATLSIGNQAFTLVQNAAATPCALTVSPLSLTVGAAGGVRTVAITAASSTCGWTAASNANWVALTGPSSGSGSAEVSFTVSPNTGTSQRSGSVSVAGQTVAVTQAAAASASCTFTLSATAQSLPTSGGQGQIAVTASASTCAWAASTSASWISITEGTSGTGNGTVKFTASENTSTSPRTGTLTIAGEAITITQLGRRIDLKGTMSSQSGSCPNLTFRLDGRNVRTNQETSFATPCDKLKNGTKVEVEGIVQIDGVVLASRVASD